MSYDPQNIFAKIIRGEAPAFSVYESEHCLAFLDVMPQSDGHTLLLPKTAAENLFDLDPTSAEGLLISAQHVARGIQSAFTPDGIKLMQFNGTDAGQTVFHFHIHIVPCYRGQSVKPHGANMAPTETLEQHAAKIRAALADV
jgi:histidine triad (HIT) family protein